MTDDAEKAHIDNLYNWVKDHKKRIDFLEKTVSKLWDEHYKLEEQIREMKAKA